MKLEPQARPVKINRLQLGGKFVYSKRDLLENFYIDEIIDNVGEKFVHWLERQNDIEKKERDEVNDIFNADDMQREDKALKLLKVFFPQIEITQASDFIIANIGKAKIICYSLLRCVDPDLNLANELLKNENFDRSLGNDWLEKCHKTIDHDEQNAIEKKFLELYSPTIKQSESETPVQIEHGSSYHIGEDFSITIAGDQIEMIWIKDCSEEEGFHISKSRILEGMFVELIGDKKHQVDRFHREDCEELLKKLEKETGYSWNFPTKKQLEVAMRSGKVEKCSSKEADWIERYYNKEACMVKNCNPVDNISKCYLRPVINPK